MISVIESNGIKMKKVLWNTEDGFKEEVSLYQKKGEETEYYIVDKNGINYLGKAKDNSYYYFLIIDKAFKLLRT